MKQKCTYHPTDTAHWYCEKCNKALCPQCVDAREMGGYHQGEKLHMCPNCNIPLQWMGVENIIDPFWKRMPQFFLYPFSIRPLILMIGLSFLSSFLMIPGVIGLLSTLALWGVTFKYAYAILQSTASGGLTAPKLNTQTLSENIGPVIKQIGLYVAIFFSAGIVFAKLGLVVGGLFLFFAMLFLPAMIILLVTTESLLQAINPMMFVTLASRIGWGYLLMVFFYTILGGAPALLGQHVIQYLPPVVQVFLFTLVKIYYTFITYHLMGYVILQYHQNIGYRVDVEDFKDETSEQESIITASDDTESRILKRIHQLIKDGDHKGAIAVIEREMGSLRIKDPTLSLRYFTLLKLTGEKERQLVHGRNHLRILVHENKKTEAIDAYLECVSLDTGFSPAAIVLFKLGAWFNETGRSKEAIGVFNKLIKAYPADPLVPKSYFHAAQIFNDRLLNPQKAKMILNGLLSKYPGHDIIPFVERYMRGLSQTIG